MAEIKPILHARLNQNGVEGDLIPGYIRSLANSFLLYPEMTLPQLNQHMRYIGWEDVELDYHTLTLAKACLESEGAAEYC